MTTHISATPYSLHGATSEIDSGVLGYAYAGRSCFASIDEAKAFAVAAIREAASQGWSGDIEIAIHDETSADPIETVAG